MNKIGNFFAGIGPWFKALSPNTKAVAVISLLIIGFYLFFSIAKTTVTNRSESMLEPYRYADTIINKMVNLNPRHEYFPASKHTEMKNQFLILQNRKMHHLKVSLFFLRNHYATIILLMLLSSVGALVLFVLVSKGWGPAGPVMRAIFFGIVLATLFYGLFPRVFKQQDNYKGNLTKYIEYSKMQISIAQQLSDFYKPVEFFDSTRNTWRPDTTSYWARIDTVVRNNYTQINQLNDFLLTIDVDQVKSLSEMYKSLNSMVNSYQTDSTNH